MRAHSRASLRDEVEALLLKASVPDAHWVANWLLTEFLHCTRADIVARPDTEVTQNMASAIWKAAKRCALREPVQYVTGHANFRTLRLRVTPDVLIPRPETEELVEAVLARLHALQAPHVLDIGTGSGCIALAIKHARADADVVACDVSREALKLAQHNATMHGLAVEFVQADVTEKAFISQLGTGCFDLMVSNPPYVPDSERDALQPEIRNHEPPVALYCGADPLHYYRAIARALQQNVICPRGVIALEVHADYAHSVASLLRKSGCRWVEVRLDLAGQPRMILAQWRGTGPE